MEEKFLEAKMLDITKNTGTNMLDIYFFLSTLNIKEMEFESQSLKRKFFYNLFTFDYYHYAPI